MISFKESESNNVKDKNDSNSKKLLNKLKLESEKLKKRNKMLMIGGLAVVVILIILIILQN